MRTGNYAYTWPLTAADWRGTFTRSAAGYAGRDTEQDVQTLADAEAARAFLMERVAAFVKKSRRRARRRADKAALPVLAVPRSRGCAEPSGRRAA